MMRMRLRMVLVLILPLVLLHRRRIRRIPNHLLLLLLVLLGIHNRRRNHRPRRPPHDSNQKDSQHGKVERDVDRGRRGADFDPRPEERVGRVAVAPDGAGQAVEEEGEDAGEVVEDRGPEARADEDAGREDEEVVRAAAGAEEAEVDGEEEVEAGLWGVSGCFGGEWVFWGRGRGGLTATTERMKGMLPTEKT